MQGVAGDVFLRVCLVILLPASVVAHAEPLGLPPVPVPADNPMTNQKSVLGDRLFNDARFSTTGDVSCATCHEAEKVFTDSPLKVSEGIGKLKGTRNAPPVVNAAYNQTQFWDGRSPSLEDQAQHPFLNPVEMGLKSHDKILEVILGDKIYQKYFYAAFRESGRDVTMTHVLQAIASFERTQVSGDSRFDRYHFGGETNALTVQEKRGLAVFLGNGRCVSCHTIEQDHALFTDHRFHNIGVGVNELGDKIVPLARAFLVARTQGVDVDVAVLTDPDTSHLGRFAVNGAMSDLGAFKTPTLRNVALTPPYMHDGSLKTLQDVMTHYNNGGALRKNQKITVFLSGGMRPLNLTDAEMDNLVAFMEALNSPRFEPGSQNFEPRSQSFEPESQRFESRFE